MRRHAIVWALLLLSRGAPHAEELSRQADRELAERNFRIGSERYEETDYTSALESFRRARASYPSSALDYNVGRCLDRLDRPEEAIVEYERYLGKSPRGASADDVRARVVVLRRRVAELAAEHARRDDHRGRPVYKRWWLWTSISVAVAGGVAIGLGLGLGLQRPSAPTATTDYGTVRFP